MLSFASCSSKTRQTSYITFCRIIIFLLHIFVWLNAFKSCQKKGDFFSSPRKTLVLPLHREGKINERTFKKNLIQQINCWIDWKFCFNKNWFFIPEHFCNKPQVYSGAWLKYADPYQSQKANKCWWPSSLASSNSKSTEEKKIP